VVNRAGRYLLTFVIIVGLMALMFTRIPKSFLPDEDQGVLFAQVTTPSGATSERTEKALAEVRDYFLNDEKEAVEGVFTVSGFSFAGRGQTSGLVFVRLKPWHDRPGARNRVQAIAARANQRFGTIADAQAVAFAPPAALELGNATGFDLELLDRANQGHDKLMAARNLLLGMAQKDPRLVGVRPNGLDDEPQYQFNVDWEEASALGLTISDINNTLSAAWGSKYVDDFIDRGRVKRVFIQGDAPSRMLPQELTDWYVRTRPGRWCPFPVSPMPNGPMARPSSSATTACPRWRFSATRSPASAPGPPWRRWNPTRRSCRRVSISHGPACPMKSDCRAHRHRLCTPFR